MTTTTQATSPTTHWSHRDAMPIARVAYDRLATTIEGLGPDDWGRPTDCDGWTVRDMVGHIVGAMRSAASVRELASQQREIKARVRAGGGNEVDVMTQVQIDRTAALSPSEIVAECRTLVDAAVTGRRRMPAPVRRFATIPVEIGTISERWRIGYLIDTILTRDAWLHRIDLHRAVGTEPVLTPDHDGVIVADVAREWFARHGQACTLVLTGPAGGAFGSGGERLELDAVEFCRILSGRATGDGLLRTDVPF